MGEYDIFKGATAELDGNKEHGSGCQCGCGPKPQAPVVDDEKAAREEVERARNKRVRAPRSAPGPGGPPPFSDHS